MPSFPVEGPILNFSLDGNSILVEFKKKGFLSISAIDDRTIHMKWSLNYINNEDHNQNRFDNVLYDDKFLTINKGYVKLVLGGNEIDYYSKDEIVRKEFLHSIGTRNLIISKIREDSILSGT